MAHATALTWARPQRDQLNKIAERRLYPRFSDPNFLVLRMRRIIFEKWIAGISGEQLNILDVGGRYQPYRPLFETRYARYTACDIERTELVDVLGSGDSLPFAHNTFDVVICTQVFECFAQPRHAAKEIHATLKPGGALLMSVASVAPRFTDIECWRFTPKGIRETLADFSEVTIVPETSSAGGILRTINLAAHSFLRSRTLKAAASVTVCPLLNLTGLALEKLAVTSNDQFTPNYSVFAIK
jgi:SAM-dependent methyltransferase